MRKFVSALSLLLAIACTGGTSETSAPPLGDAAADLTIVAPTWKPPELPECDPIRLLVTYDYEEVQRRYCELCQAHDPMACELDWPSSDVMMCAEYDNFRNGIYAYYGFEFQNPEWKQKFAATPWYKPNPKYSEADLSGPARRNVEWFKNAAREQKMCLGKDQTIVPG